MRLMLTSCLLWTCLTTTVPAASEPAPAPPERRFEQYQLVLLMAGPTRTEGVTDEVRALQVQHLAHLTAMADAGHMVIAGPFGDQADPAYRGMCLYRVGSVEKARALAEADPMVKAGRLRAEVMTWYVEEGWVAFPKAKPAAPETKPTAP